MHLAPQVHSIECKLSMDLKCMNLVCGLQTASSKYPCAYCEFVSMYFQFCCPSHLLTSIMFPGTAYKQCKVDAKELKKTRAVLREHEVTPHLTPHLSPHASPPHLTRWWAPGWRGTQGPWSPCAPTTRPGRRTARGTGAGSATSTARSSRYLVSNSVEHSLMVC